MSTAVPTRPGRGRHRAPENWAGAAPKGFRKDIQGLRAIAVGGVVLYHLWPERLQGGFAGVDVFFVISGFLITSHLVRRPPLGAGNVLDFWARRIKRLLPAALLVLAVTALGVWLLAPISEFKDSGKQIIASAGYVQNWVLAFDSVDYLAAENAPTAVQHFWSLSVEEQFYFVWPLVIAACALVTQRSARARSTVMRAAAIGLAAASLAYCVFFTAAEPAMAYFVTPTRMWELLAGGVVALFALPDWLRGALARAGLAWLGIAGIAAAFLVIKPNDSFPGYVALLPIASTALFIWAHSTSAWGPEPILRWRPIQFAGDTSYSIYLWHWPLIVLLPNVLGTLHWPVKLGIIAVTVLLAWASAEFVENRFRASAVFSGRKRTFAAAALGMLVAMSAGGGLWWTADWRQAETASALDRAISSGDPCLGAGALDARARDPKACPEPAEPIQDPASAKTDKSDAYPDKCWTSQPFNARKTCTYGSGPTRVALVGNSHAGQWLPALQQLAQQRGWTITTYLVDTCNVSHARQSFDTAAKADGCEKYSRWVEKQTSEKHYDAVITSERQVNPVEGHTLADTEDAAAAGYKPVLRAWHRAGVPVAILADTPFPSRTGVNVPDCVGRHGPEAAECQGTPASWKPLDPLKKAAKGLDYADQKIIEPASLLCPEGQCRAVIGGVITYFDSSHMTATYARTAAPWLGRKLDSVGISALKG